MYLLEHGLELVALWEARPASPLFSVPDEALLRHTDMQAVHSNSKQNWAIPPGPLCSGLSSDGRIMRWRGGILRRWAELFFLPLPGVGLGEARESPVSLSPEKITAKAAAFPVLAVVQEVS